MTRAHDPWELDVTRRCRFAPYRKGSGPTFSLLMYDTHRTDARGTTTIGYKLTMREGGRSVVLFSGEDFNASPVYAVDDGRTVSALMGFLCLRPGDTDADYFARYTDAQTAFASAHAESLYIVVTDRFGED